MPSIWDEADDEEPFALDDTLDPFAPPIPMAERRPDWLDPRAWIAAEASSGRVLVDAAEAVGRVDERLRRAPEPTRQAWRERLALEEISALLWAEGIRLRPETLALADADRLGRTGDADQVITRGQWARRRLLGQGALTTTADGMMTFLGRAALTDPAVQSSDPWTALPEPLVPTGPDPHGMGRWCAAMDTLQNTHPLTRAAAAFAMWRGMGLNDLDALLEPGVIAARVAAAGARGGLSSVPLSAGAPRLGQAGGHAPMRLENWLLAVAETAAHAQMQLDRLEAWHARAIDRAVEMKGKGAPALLA
ncbi:MAG: hypothetical protein AAF409_11920, partial [Pseudomonadota bacterium]